MLFHFENLHGETIKVNGRISVTFSYQKQTAQVTLIVTTGDGPRILGCDWLKGILLDWNQLNRVCQSASYCQKLVEIKA